MQGYIDYNELLNKTKMINKVSMEKIAKFEKHMQLFPPLADKTIRGIFNGLSVEISGKTGRTILQQNGKFGYSKSLRTSRRKVKKYLILEIEEAFYLAHVLKALEIYDTKEQLLTFSNFLSICLKVDENFIENFAAYLYLKSKGWIVKSDVNYGGKYAIYRTGPEYFHASFIVLVTKFDSSSIAILKANYRVQRIADINNKDVLHLEVSKTTNSEIKSIEDFQGLQISEVVRRKFNFLKVLSIINSNNNKR
ncbi:tRNA-splicing endonuclease subunit Sen2 [Teleopsis dalmanni]|uniref:tRNA-splicing endonuclease subunit Sen2 n=1 Tax=Teleopsis dalmanni TaxID=139649 RepID=UPI0018CDF5B2|nr:tRNA-splicing endonuclease subunit Sen2 [Teleopsis dalmanni]